MKAKQTNKIGHIEVDDVYVTVLTGRLETNEEGWQKVVPTDRSQRMTGSMIINAVVKILMETSTRRAEQVAALLEVDALELTHAVHLLTGLSLQEFILGYRNRQAVEYVQCTSHIAFTRRDCIPLRLSINQYVCEAIPHPHGDATQAIPGHPPAGRRPATLSVGLTRRADCLSTRWQGIGFCVSLQHENV